MSATINESLAIIEARVRELTDENMRLKGKLSARSRTLVKLRDKIILITDHIVEEGDATYFGSTNDADELISLKDALENWAWIDIMKDAKPDDPYKACRIANEKVATLTAENTRLATEKAQLNSIPTNWELSCENEDRSDLSSDLVWVVYSVNGGRNDREWSKLGQGDTPSNAISAAFLAAAIRKGAHHER